MHINFLLETFPIAIKFYDDMLLQQNGIQKISGCSVLSTIRALHLGHSTSMALPWLVNQP